MILNNGQMERGVGFCLNLTCPDWNKDVFLMAHPGRFVCSRCHEVGIKEIEMGETDNNYSLDFWQVRVEFNYNIALNEYRSIAIVTDETMPKDGNVYTLKTPLVRTEKRALQVAEMLLGNLMRADDSIFAKGYLKRDETYIVDFDKPLIQVTSELEAIEKVLNNSRLRKI